MQKRSPLLSLVALLLVVGSPVLLFYKLSERSLDLNYISEGTTTDALIEAKLDSTTKNLEGKDLGFIMASYREPNYHSEIPEPSNSTDSSYIDSVVALKRMLVAENFKQKIPGIRFVRVEVEKSVLDTLTVGKQVKLTYSTYHPDMVRLAALNIPSTNTKDNSIWITGCIISFMVGVWIMIMKRRRKKQEQELDPLSGMTSFSTIKKDQGPKTGGRPGV